VVYPQALLRQALVALLLDLGSFGTVLGAKNAEQALDLVAARSPGLVLIGGAPPEVDIVGVGRAIHVAAPRTSVVAFVPSDSGDVVLDLLRVGVQGCLDRDAGQAELHLAVQTITTGGTYVSPSIVEELATGARGGAFELLGSPGPVKDLSARELQVLQLAAEGYGNTAVAQELRLSVKTVEAHKAHIAHKLGVRGSAGLIKYAIRKGLVDLEPRPAPPVDSVSRHKV
jgi:DNA-binding NarL/FixJ family response regulator